MLLCLNDLPQLKNCRLRNSKNNSSPQFRKRFFWLNIENQQVYAIFNIFALSTSGSEEGSQENVTNLQFQFCRLTPR